MNILELRREFKKEKGFSCVNEQDEYDLEYVEWLEKKVLDHSNNFIPSKTEQSIEKIATHCVCGLPFTEFRGEKICSGALSTCTEREICLREGCGVTAQQNYRLCQKHLREAHEGGFDDSNK